VRRTGELKDMQGDRTKTADPNGPKGYSTLYGVILSNKTGGVEWGGCCCSETGCTSVGRW